MFLNQTYWAAVDETGNIFSDQTEIGINEDPNVIDDIIHRESSLSPEYRHTYQRVLVQIKKVNKIIKK